MFSISTPGNACLNRPEGIAVAKRWAGPPLQHSHCEGPQRIQSLALQFCLKQKWSRYRHLGFIYKFIDFEVLVSGPASEVKSMSLSREREKRQQTRAGFPKVRFLFPIVPGSSSGELSVFPFHDSAISWSLLCLDRSRGRLW